LDTAEVTRPPLLDRAIVLEYVTIGWMFVEFALALAAGIVASSFVLVAFSLDSVVEIGHAGLLLWRLRAERTSGAAVSEQVEERAAKVGGLVLTVLAVYIAASGGWELLHRQGASFSPLGLGITLAAIPIMWLLARRKLELAAALDSRALRGEAAESLSCWYLSAVAVVAVIAQGLFGAWWIDGVGALVAAAFIAREAMAGLRGDDCCD